MKIVVQKFGGTSVATADRRERAIQKVLKSIENGYRSVVVVSAMGRKGEPYATDTLIGVLKSVWPQIPLREMDLLMSCGEIISSCVMTTGLINKGHKAMAMTGFQAGIMTDSNYGNANVVKVDTSKILKYLDEGYIPVIAGFQGADKNNNITTLGRGASDYTACILGEALKAESIEIYTDVDGIMTADPSIVSDAKKITQINYNEVFQMAEQGAKVIHPRAVEVAMRSNIPLLVKNTMSDDPGTVIANYNETMHTSDDKNKLVTGIAHITGRTQFVIDVPYEDDAENYVFEQLMANKISIDLINVSSGKLEFTVDDIKREGLKKILNEKSFKYTVRDNCSVVSVIGHRISGVPGVMGRIVKALNRQKIDILQTSDSHMTISCLVDSSNIQKAVIALHNEFKLND